MFFRPKKTSVTIIIIVALLIVFSLFFTEIINRFYFIVFYVLLYLVTSAAIFYVFTTGQRIVDEEMRQNSREISALFKQVNNGKRDSSKINKKTRNIILNQFDETIHELNHQLIVLDKQPYPDVINEIDYLNGCLLRTFNEIENDAESWKYYKEAEKLVADQDFLLYKLKSLKPNNMKELKKLLQNYVKTLNSLKKKL